MTLPAPLQPNPTDAASGLAAVLPAAPSATVYDEYYAFIEPPFGLTPNTRFFFWGGSHAQALEQVMLALRAREGVVVVTGGIGTGKTMLCWVVAHHVRTNALLSMFVNPTLGPDDLLKQILEDFGAVPHDRPIAETGYALFRMLEQFLVERIRQGERAVILIDEAHQLRPEVIEQIRLLSNLESEHAKLLQIILIGLPELDAVLRRPEHQRFDERVSRRCELLPLPRAEIGRYVERRLAIAQAFDADAAGDPSPVQAVLSGSVMDAVQVQGVQFTADALVEIAARTRGIPRQINLLSDRALELGHERQTRTIDRALVRAAASRLKLPTLGVWGRPGARIAMASAAVLLIGVAAATTGWWLASQARQPRAAARTETAVAAATTTPPTTLPASATAPAGGRLESAPSVMVAAVSFETAERADEVVGGLERLGLPAFARVAPASRWHQAVVGPYVSVDEARAAERHFSTLRITDPVILLVGRPERPARARSANVGDGNAIGRVLILPVEDRVSLLVESRDPGVEASRESVSDTALAVDIGPVTSPVQPEERDAGPGTPLISHVSIQEARKPGGKFIHVRVTLRTPSHSKVRVDGRRVYLDFSPLVPTPGARTLPETVVDDPEELDRNDFNDAARILQRASQLAAKSDVQGLERLHAAVQQGAGAANQQSEDFKRVIDELERYTREARARRLQQDALLFRR